MEGFLWDRTLFQATHAGGPFRFAGRLILWGRQINIPNYAVAGVTEKNFLTRSPLLRPRRHRCKDKQLMKENP